VNILAELTIKQQLEKYLIDHPSGRINTAELARTFRVTRQHICHQLDRLGEERHHRLPPTPNHCQSCSIVISKSATYCRTHAKILERHPGQYYQCRACKAHKLLEHFAKSNISFSGYETRCLDCRAEWQRNYYRTTKGKESHVKTTRALSQKHPERQRAYYQVYKALKNGTLTKEICFQCENPNTQAVHSDYRHPLNVIWTCLTCRSDIPITKIEYTSNPLEEGFRDFIRIKIGKTNGLGRWLEIIKQHYQIYFITNQIFLTSIEDYKDINGLGKQYKNLASQYANKLWPENHA
jgi:hypothetical protein